MALALGVPFISLSLKKLAGPRFTALLRLMAPSAATMPLTVPDTLSVVPAVASPMPPSETMALLASRPPLTLRFP
jgi:hypothetical protein